MLVMSIFHKRRSRTVHTLVQLFEKMHATARIDGANTKHGVINRTCYPVLVRGFFNTRHVFCFIDASIGSKKFAISCNLNLPVQGFTKAGKTSSQRSNVKARQVDNCRVNTSFIIIDKLLFTFNDFCYNFISCMALHC